MSTDEQIYSLERIIEAKNDEIKELNEHIRDLELVLNLQRGMAILKTRKADTHFNQMDV